MWYESGASASISTQTLYHGYGLDGAQFLGIRAPEGLCASRLCLADPGASFLRRRLWCCSTELHISRIATAANTGRPPHDRTRVVCASAAMWSI
ncbi:uncharacterized protein LAESUDRAFT_732537 [Laetiporus sulphureus 93-53]|uniref:Uncharacterized protein n=1 Tax=Laetiporus sulphureus 93-53 TaxID=1314785 RepID=A0A165ATS2_9APHY|nr:uncharacterized protein LAESUDRAFT_733018 [Laetiporus sulphureus 93-53]XP_040757943.1 uncharacterized protein LAESUDRAFT_732537 [Laetiporus sulphureus 93-53]KZS99648.1 hypothetical protein LAESUDRAFT_733018 [Laetiporus sulphureus 93-53]KZT00203.1 hypothetical protein LAESUDRAFT_732537 [Laetiporus sulphureus 93-53]